VVQNYLTKSKMTEFNPQIELTELNYLSMSHSSMKDYQVVWGTL